MATRRRYAVFAVFLGLLAVSLGGRATRADTPPPVYGGPTAPWPVPLTATAGPGYAVSTFATGFAMNGCCGPIGLTFNSADILYVSDIEDGYIYIFGPAGGPASRRLPAPSIPGALSGLAFGQDGSLYAVTQGGQPVLQLDPATGVVLRTVATGIPCAAGLAVDPLSGDLFVSQLGCAPNIVRISHLQSPTPTVSVYASPGGTDGLTFAPDGTLYSESNGCATRISGTNQPQPPTITQIACVNEMDGIALSPTSNPAKPLLFANRNDGVITKIDQRTSPPTLTDIVTGGSRGDFVTVGTDGCLYATQTTSVEKVTNFDGTCSWIPSGVAPALRLTPDAHLPTLLGDSTAFVASLTNVPTPAGTGIEVTVSGANPLRMTVRADAAGQAIFQYAGSNLGPDDVMARAAVVTSAGVVGLSSNPALVLWENAALAISPVSGSFTTQVTMTGAHFGPQEPVAIYWDTTSATPLVTTTSSAAGVISTTFLVPQAANGRHTVIGVGSASGHRGQFPFQVTPAAILAPPSGSPGTNAVVAAYGLVPAEPVNVYLGSTSGQLLASTTADANGSAGVTFVVPQLSAGPIQIVVHGQTSGITLANPFQVVPFLGVTPSSGTAGSTPAIYGSGFAANETVTVRWACATSSCGSTPVLGTVTANGTGAFTLLTGTIPAAPTGTYSIGALGSNSGAFAATDFTVTP